jgi:D-sedoheptulose 7-phosphate isomerase
MKEVGIGSSVLIRNIKACIKTQELVLIDSELRAVFDNAINAVIGCYRLGGRLYIAGNGGSAADAQHLAAEFVSKLAIDRFPLPAEALTVDSSVLTAIGNDYGFDHVFSRQLAAKLTKNDIFLAITTSGRSPNILRALEICREKEVRTILFSGRDGGIAKDLADFPIVVPGEMTSTIQELHILLAHTLCESVELAIFA